MVRRREILLIALIVVTLSGLGLGADLFPTEVRKQAFLRALAEQDENYDPAEQMLAGEFSSPGYHTTLTGGTVHRTRHSLEYAVALLDSGDPNRLGRAEQILRRVISLQDQDPSSRTYGIWPWFLEEPLDQMSPPDWNWADFCGTQLLQVAIDHMSRLPDDLQQQVRNSILHAARSIKKRDVGPGYTNIALMGTYVTLVAGERFGVPELRNYGKQRLRWFYEYTQEQGSLTEYNSPTYTCVAIEEISRMRQHVRDEDSQDLLRRLNEFAWRHVAHHFHAPTKQWAGPHSRCYSTLLQPGTLAFIQRATGGEIEFLPEAEAWESIEAQRLDLECPPGPLSYFQTLTWPRTEVEAFVRSEDRDEPGIIGTTYLHPDFTLASVNIGDLWNQRRPLLAYWNTAAGPAAMRLRCLHDGYDYASAGLFTIQDTSDILGAILFATDRGDTHISLDKITNATIRASDLRVRLQFEGAIGDLMLPAKPELDEPIRFTSGPIAGAFCVHAATFAGLPVRFETGRDAEAAWIDVVLYNSVERQFDFSRIEEATIVFTLSMAPAGTLSRYAEASVYAGIATALGATTDFSSPRKVWHWQRTNRPTLALTIPVRPLRTHEQKAATEAKRSDADPWKAAY